MSQPSTGIHVSLPPAGPSWAAVFGVAQLSHSGGISPGFGSAQLSLLSPCCEKQQESFSPCQARAADRAGGCPSEPAACPVCAQVPGAGQGGGGPRQLYRARVSTRRRGRSRARQERPVPRPVPRGRAHGPEVRPGRGGGCSHTWPGPGCFPCCPKLCPIPGAVFVRAVQPHRVHLLLGQGERLEVLSIPGAPSLILSSDTEGRGSLGRTLCSGRCRGFQWPFALQDGVQVPRKQHSASSFLQQAD